jgi:hypothetical protein
MADYFGASIRRREDPRLLKGLGHYVDDIVRPGMLHCAFLRSVQLTGFNSVMHPGESVSTDEPEPTLGLES